MQTKTVYASIRMDSIEYTRAIFNNNTDVYTKQLAFSIAEQLIKQGLIKYTIEKYQTDLILHNS